MALPAQIARTEPIGAPVAEPVAAPAVTAMARPSSARVRRCTFRRLSRVSREDAYAYAVSCLYPDRKLPLPLGDAASSLPICEACSASHIFRPDED
jgi:hypothetical protein